MKRWWNTSVPQHRNAAFVMVAVAMGAAVTYYGDWWLRATAAVLLYGLARLLYGWRTPLLVAIAHAFIHAEALRRGVIREICEAASRLRKFHQHQTMLVRDEVSR